EAEYVSGTRPNTRKNYNATFDIFERLCSPTSLKGVTGRTISRFVGALRKEPGRGSPAMLASTIRVRLEFLRAALHWAARQKLIPECPEFPAVKVSKKKPQPVPVESFERLLAKAPDRETRA